MNIASGEHRKWFNVGKIEEITSIYETLQLLLFQSVCSWLVPSRSKRWWEWVDVSHSGGCQVDCSVQVCVAYDTVYLLLMKRQHHLVNGTNMNAWKYAPCHLRYGRAPAWVSVHCPPGVARADAVRKTPRNRPTATSRLAAVNSISRELAVSPVTRMRVRQHPGIVGRHRFRLSTQPDHTQCGCRWLSLARSDASWLDVLSRHDAELMTRFHYTTPVTVEANWGTALDFAVIYNILAYTKYKLQLNHLLSRTIGVSG